MVAVGTRIAPRPPAKSTSSRLLRCTVGVGDGPIADNEAVNLHRSCGLKGQVGLMAAALMIGHHFLRPCSRAAEISCPRSASRTHASPGSASAPFGLAIAFFGVQYPKIYFGAGGIADEWWSTISQRSPLWT